jgi:hypothetical protein
MTFGVVPGKTDGATAPAGADPGPMIAEGHFAKAGAPARFSYVRLW